MAHRRRCLLASALPAPVMHGSEASPDTIGITAGDRKDRMAGRCNDRFSRQTRLPDSLENARTFNRVLFALFCLVLNCEVQAAGDTETEDNRFCGRIIVEWVDDPFVPLLRVLEDFFFFQRDGKVWKTPAGAIVAGRSIPPLFVQLKGHPFQGGFRKTAITYDYAVTARKRPWQDADRMFYEGAVTEGVLPVEAKVMYLLLYATGPRWAVSGTRDCHGRCHRRDEELAWSPQVDHEQILSLVSWVHAQDPSLDSIEQHVDKVIIQAGPHVIGPFKH